MHPKYETDTDNLKLYKYWPIPILAPVHRPSLLAYSKNIYVLLTTVMQTIFAFQAFRFERLKWI